MKKKNKFLTFALTSVLSIGLLAACGTGGDSQQGAAPTPTPEVEEKVTLVMGTSADYPPYEFIDTAVSEDIIGFDIDIANYIAEQLGFELKIEDMDFNGLVPALTNNRLDFVLAGMTPTPERLENVDFSDIYYVAEQTIVFNTEKHNFEALEDLAGMKIGVQLGSIQVGIANDIAEEISFEIVELNRITDLIQDLKTGRIDAAIIEDTVGKGHITANPELASFVIVEEGEAGSAVAFPKGSELVDEFNRVLQEMKENGELEKLILKWFYSEE